MVASICTRWGACVTCTCGMVITCRTFPENGATTAISIFMASSTAKVSPAATVSPGLTAMDTTTDGPGACTTPPSSRSIECDTPSTSIREFSPWTTETTWKRRPKSGEPVFKLA